MNTVHLLRRRPTSTLAVAAAAVELAATSASGTTAAAARHTPASASTTPRRFVSSFRRTQKALRVPPAPSFTPSPSPRRTSPNPASDRQQPQRQQQIIFNPPSSAPSVYHTPLKFLPASDPRRELLLAEARRREELASGVSSSSSGDVAVAGNAAGSGGLRKVAEMRAAEARARSQSQPPSSASSIPLPPALDRPYEKKYHLTPAEIAEMQRLRTEDPQTWTRRRLAEKFACSEFFVSIASAAPAEFRAARAAELDAVKSRWGRTKREAREDRATRKSAWGRDA